MNNNVKLGNSLERFFDKCLSVKDWVVIRIPDGCKQIATNKIIRKKSPFDFLAVKKYKQSLYCDTKTIEGDRFPYSKINQDQVKELLAIERCGHVAGYIVHFRQVDTFGFLSAKLLSEVARGTSVRASLAIDLGKEIDVDRLFRESGNIINNDDFANTI